MVGIHNQLPYCNWDHMVSHDLTDHNGHIHTRITWYTHQHISSRITLEHFTYHLLTDNTSNSRDHVIYQTLSIILLMCPRPQPTSSTRGKSLITITTNTLYMGNSPSPFNITQTITDVNCYLWSKMCC